MGGSKLSSHAYGSKIYVIGTHNLSHGNCRNQEVVSRTVARSPPPTHAGGQDDGSYPNSLKKDKMYPHIPPHQGSGAGIAIKGDAWVS